MRKLTSVILAATAAVATNAVSERDARACGGCFHPPTETDSVITDHRMVLTVSSTQTTLYDQIRYQGNPADSRVGLADPRNCGRGTQRGRGVRRAGCDDHDDGASAQPSVPRAAVELPESARGSVRARRLE